MLVKIADIKVKRRVRKDLGNLDQLKDSLRTYGLLNPITLTSNHELVAGERRLEAAKALGWESINAVIIDTKLTKLQKLEMEIDENNQRKEFTEDELLDGYHRLEKLRNPSIFSRILSFFAGIFQKIIDFFKGLGKNKKKSLPQSNSQDRQIVKM